MLNVVVERLTRDALKNVSRERSGIVRIGRRRSRGKDPDRQMRLHVFIERRKAGCIGDKKLFLSLLKSRSVGHDVAQRNGLGISLRNFEIEVVVDVAIQVKLAQLDLLHNSGPIEQLRN